MLTNVYTSSLLGMEAEPVMVETDIQPGLPAVNMVGLADTTIKEARERIRAAIINSGYEFPRRRLTVNLSPAGRPKEGSHFDLPIAVGILLLNENRPVNINLRETAFMGELSLDGRVKHIRGALPLAIGLRGQGIRRLVLPAENKEEVSLIKELELCPVACLTDCMAYIGSGSLPAERRPQAEPSCSWITGGGREAAKEDFAQIVGQEQAKRAAMVAAAGQHGILFMGSPGSGKTMLARRIPDILPELSQEEQLEVVRIYSAAGLLPGGRGGISIKRPFRAPHHSISRAALIGGGRHPGPGELSLAHNGVLFLDELGEFNQTILDQLRQPLEEGSITINRNWGTAVFPCRAMLVAAANPCRCGYLGDERHACTCTRPQLERYFSRFSGPFLDRVDLHVRVFPPTEEQLAAGADGTAATGAERNAGKETIWTTVKMAARVRTAVERQAQRYQGTALRFNSRLQPGQFKAFCPMTAEAESLLRQARERMALSMRAYHKMIKVARTIADLDEAAVIEAAHIAEALQYRSLDMLYRHGENQ